MIARLFAVWLVVLCILPTTAPFSAVPSAHPLSRHNTAVAIGTSVTPTSVTDSDDDNDAVVLAPSAFLKQSRLRATVVVPTCGGTSSGVALFFAQGSPSAFTIDSPPLNTVLRV